MSKKEPRIDYVRSYLREIGRIPLLTREQEIEYGQQVQQMMLLLEVQSVLAKKLRREPTLREWASHVQLSESEVNQILQRGQSAKCKMVEANLRLVVSVAKKYQKCNMELLDLIQEGTLGLQRGTEKFDPTRGYKFSTYAYHWIRQAITRAIAQQSRTIRLPVHITEKLNKIKKTQQQLSQQLGRTPTVNEVAHSLGLTALDLQQLLSWTRKLNSLNVSVGSDHDTELGELLLDTSATPEDLVLQSCLTSDLKGLVAELTPAQRDVLTLRFGLEDGRPLTLAAVGFRLNLSRERVRQLEQKAIDTLRHHKPMLVEYLIANDASK